MARGNYFFFWHWKVIPWIASSKSSDQKVYIKCVILNYKVKLGDKERFDKEQIGVKLVNIYRDQFANLLHMKDKEHLELRNNFKVTKKFLITKFDCSILMVICGVWCCCRFYHLMNRRLVWFRNNIFWWLSVGIGVVVFIIDLKYDTQGHP